MTHVITTRTIPPERAQAGAEGSAATASTEPEQQLKHTRQHTAEEQPQTINPSLLNRNTAARRKLLFEFRQPHVASQQPDEAVRRSSSSSKPRNNDVLHKARDMGKKIWSLEKIQTMLSVLESEGHANSASRSMSMRSQHGASKSSHEPNLLQLLHNERINGPSDRDPTAVSRELVYFKGPYIYVWDMDEKQRPIMVRDYPKVANKTDGEWPQFRSVGNGRCPFVEEVDAAPEKDYRKSREREKARAAVAAAKREDDPVPVLKPPKTIPLAKPVTGKRTLAEMDDGDRNRAAARAPTPAATGIPAKTAPAHKGEEAQSTQNAFISRATGGGRLLGGEPVASGLQPSNITSTIRSQMISSTSGINGAKAGTSKEVHGLQRKVLQKATTPASHDPSSRRLAEISADAGSSRSTNMGRQTSRTIQGQDEDDRSQRPAAAAAEGKERTLRTQQTLKSKKELKPGYCENCQDKFRDFDEVGAGEGRDGGGPSANVGGSTLPRESTASLPKTTKTGPSLTRCCLSWNAFPSTPQASTLTRRIRGDGPGALGPSSATSGSRPGGGSRQGLRHRDAGARAQVVGGGLSRGSTQRLPGPGHPAPSRISDKVGPRRRLIFFDLALRLLDMAYPLLSRCGISASCFIVRPLGTFFFSQWPRRLLYYTCPLLVIAGTFVFFGLSYIIHFFHHLPGDRRSSPGLAVHGRRIMVTAWATWGEE